jgi:hypothetical protein
MILDPVGLAVGGVSSFSAMSVLQAVLHGLAGNARKTAEMRGSQQQHGATQIRALDRHLI